MGCTRFLQRVFPINVGGLCAAACIPSPACWLGRCETQINRMGLLALSSWISIPLAADCPFEDSDGQGHLCVLPHRDSLHCHTLGQACPCNQTRDPPVSGDGMLPLAPLSWATLTYKKAPRHVEQAAAGSGLFQRQ